MAHTNFNFTESGYTPTYDFDFDPFVVDTYTLKPATNNNFVGIWADPTASIDNAMMYASTNAAMYVVKMQTKDVYDIYTQEIGGRADEVLDDDTIVDINAT
jgi:hypothetical protein